MYSGRGNLRRGNGSASGGVSWEFPAGLAATAGETAFYSEKYGIWMGKNLRLYNLNFHGNGYTGGMNKFGKTTSNVLKWTGRALGAWNAYSINEQRRKGEISFQRELVEQSSNLFSTFGGIYGGAWSIGWEGGRLITNTEWYQNAKFNFYYNYWEDQVGEPTQTNEDLWYYFYKNYK